MSTGDSEGPAWNKFWLSLDHETESVASGDGSHRPHTPGRSLMSPEASRPGLGDRVDSVLPHESASHQGDESPSDAPQPSPLVQEEAPFPFKFKAPSGRVHRLQVSPAAGMAELIVSVASKLGGEVDAVGGTASFEDGRMSETGFALSYLDNEGDTVSITTDQDLLDAIVMARHGQRDKVDLFVHDPDKPPVSATVDPRPALAKPLTPPASEIRSRRAQAMEAEDGDMQETPTRKESKRHPIATQKKQEEQVIAGVPNDLLLPGAIVALAVVIVGVFAISRSSSR